MINRAPHHPTAYDDDWEDQPAQSAFHKWGLGVLLPIGLWVWAVSMLLNGEALMPGRGGWMPLHGSVAVAFGAAWAGAGVFLHCHYFWGNVFNQTWFAVLGKIVSAIVFIAGLAYVLIRVGILGLNR